MPRRFRAFAFASFGLAVVAGCNALTQNPENRYVDAGSKGDDDDNVPTKTTKDATTDRAVTLTDSGPKITTIVIPTTTAQGAQWSSPNGATATVTADGTKITGYDQRADGSGNHPVITPVLAGGALAVPNTDYTLTATVHANQTAEFGIITRINSLGTGFLYGSRLSYDDAASEPFATTMGPTDFNPGTPMFRDGGGDGYNFTNNSNYTMELKAIGGTIEARMWLTSSNQRPASALVITDTSSPDLRGRGIAFYTYFTSDVTLISMSVSYEDPK